MAGCRRCGRTIESQKVDASGSTASGGLEGRRAAARDARNRDLGRAGEEFVVDFERSRLRRAGRSDLARDVRWVADLDGDGYPDVHTPAISTAHAVLDRHALVKGGQGAKQAHWTRLLPGSPSGGNFGPRLRHGVVNANLQHRKPRFQFAGSVGGAFYRDELRF
jgi:hypothetical protein